MSEAIEFDAVVYKVQTIASDLGVRVTLDLPEYCIPQMAMLAETKRKGMVLHFEATAIKNLTILDKTQKIEVDDNGGNAEQVGQKPERRTAKVGRRRA